MAYTINHYITDWVEESRALMQPDKVLWIDGTETQLEEMPSKDGTYNLNCAVIVKRVDAKTRSKTSINDLLRD